LVFRAAQQHDPVAIEILGSAARELVVALQAVVKGMAKIRRGIREKMPLVLMGGLLESENVYSKKVKALIRRDLPDISIVKPIAPPVQGAVLMAMARVKAGSKKAKKPLTVM
jgi:N-acetylglucosamine kinase-like BadF-type ATPase